MNSKFSMATDYIGKTVTVTIDRPLYSKHQKYGWEYKLNYGFVPNTISPDGKELDAYVIGIHEPLKTFNGYCAAVIHRLDDKDDKLIVVTGDFINISDVEIQQQTHFQEQWFDSKIIRTK